MEEELIDHFRQYPEGKGNQTITMFIISISLVAVMISSFLLSNFFRISELRGILPAFGTVCGIIAFGISIGGIVIGFSERKYSTNWVRTGLVGHFVIVIVPVLVFVYSLVDILIYW